MMDEAGENRYEALAGESPAASGDEPAGTTVQERLAGRFESGLLTQAIAFGEPTTIVTTAVVESVLRSLRDEEGYALLSDLTAHDCSVGADPRFYVVYQLTNVQTAEGLRVKVGLPETKPTVPSVVGIWPGADFMEREVYDLFGIVFEGHPNLKRILMPDEWEGYPLRKDYPVVYEPVQFTHNFEAIEATKPYARH